MGFNCADLFLFCYGRDFMKSLTKEKRYDITDAFNSTSRYLGYSYRWLHVPR